MQQIKSKLETALTPNYLTIVDESYLHAGHAGAQSGAGHFAITIAAPLLEGSSKVAAHRLIYTALADMIPSEIHALRITIQPPEAST